MPTTFTFDPERVAHAEAAGWRAYYERDWLTLLRLLVAMNESQFHIPFPASWLAAYHVVRASIAFAPQTHDLARVRAALVQFYRLARRYSGLTFDPGRSAAAEVEYWEVHRRLSGQSDKTEFIQTMIDLHSLLFGLTPEQARASAELRVQANTIVDLITSRASSDVAGDWAKLEDCLRQCYRSIEGALRMSQAL